MIARSSILIALFAATLIVYSCTSNTVIPPESNEEYIVTTDSLLNWRNWNIRGTVERPDINEFRTVYTNRIEAVDQEEGFYAQGTIIMKVLASYDSISDDKFYQVMIKRGGDFNPLGNGWEWIMTDDLNDLSTRGGNEAVMPDGTPCVACHGAQNDYVFNVYLP